VPSCNHCHSNSESDDLGKVLNCILHYKLQNAAVRDAADAAGAAGAAVAASRSARGCHRREFPEQTIDRSSAFIARSDHLVEFGSIEDAEVLDEVNDRFDLDQRPPGDVGKATKLLRAAPTHAFGKIQSDAITGTTPLVREIAFGYGESIDERSRQHRQLPRVLVGLEIFEKHSHKVESQQNPR